MVKNILFFLITYLFLHLNSFAIPNSSIDQWGVFELTLNGPSVGNPFIDVTLSAEFKKGTKVYKPEGFYDGNGIYKIRFMPDEIGTWTYTTHSNKAELDGITGSFECIAPSPGNHGPVRVKDQYHFAYSDGKRFFPVGTTLYCWELERYNETLNTLATSRINKVRYMPFPHGGNQLPIYPFKGSPNSWDFYSPNPAFWQMIDRSVKDLGNLGVQADFIFFHPYDRGQWGLDKMTWEQKKFYLKYVTSRLAAYSNVWWSMANEFSLINDSPIYWDSLAQIVADTDPFDHMQSIHDYPNTEYPWDSSSWCTHVSIQTWDVNKINSLKIKYKKPVIDDEYQYEGNVNDWGNLTGYEEVRRHWIATIEGGYATHGEAYDPYFFCWKGGKPLLYSFARVSWLSEEVMNNDAKPLPQGLENFNDQYAHVDEDYYLYYYSNSTTSGKTYTKPAGKQYYADVLDTWNMTVTEKGIYSGTFTITWPSNQYIAVRIYNTNLISGNITNQKTLPTEFSLSDNFPNPFNPSTTINYSIPQSSFVTLKMYDIIGREVATLVYEEKFPGNYEIKFNGENIPTGIYFYRMQAGNFTQTKKLILLK